MLILVRHGESKWNALEKITGQADVALTDTGKRQAQEIGDTLQNIHIDKAYVSELQRTAETLSEIQACRDIKSSIPFSRSAVLNERSFGTITGKNKRDVMTDMGTDAYTQMLKSWNVKAPQGESLEMVYERVIPFFEKTILKDLLKGSNVLVVSHHQVLRCLIMYFEDIPYTKITTVKLENAEAVRYDFDLKTREFSRRLLN